MMSNLFKTYQHELEISEILHILKAGNVSTYISPELDEIEVKASKIFTECYKEGEGWKKIDDQTALWFCDIFKIDFDVVKEIVNDIVDGWPAFPVVIYDQGSSVSTIVKGVGFVFALIYFMSNTTLTDDDEFIEDLCAISVPVAQFQLRDFKIKTLSTEHFDSIIDYYELKLRAVA
jgi:hypothetical protein